MWDGPGRTEYNSSDDGDDGDGKRSVSSSVEISFFPKEIPFLCGLNTYWGLCGYFSKC